MGARASLAEEVTFFADVLRPSEAVVGDDIVLVASAVDRPYTRTQAGVIVMLSNRSIVAADLKNCARCDDVRQACKEDRNHHL